MTFNSLYLESLISWIFFSELDWFFCYLEVFDIQLSSCLVFFFIQNLKMLTAALHSSRWVSHLAKKKYITQPLTRLVHVWITRLYFVAWWEERWDGTSLAEHNQQRQKREWRHHARVSGGHRGANRSHQLCWGPVHPCELDSVIINDLFLQ